MRWIDTVVTHLATDANGAPEVNFELVACVFVAGVLNDTIQTVPSVVDDDVNAAKVPVNPFEEHFSALDRLPDIMFDNEEFVSGVSCCELGDTGCFSCDSGHTFTSRNHLLD